MNQQPPAKKRERGVFFIVLGSIATLMSIGLFVLAPVVLASTSSADKGTERLGSAILGGLALEWARGIAQAMDNLALFFFITGVGLIVVGVVLDTVKQLEATNSSIASVRDVSTQVLDVANRFRV